MGRRGSALLVGAALSLLLAASASGDPLTDEAATIYDPHTVETVDLTLSPEAIEELEKEPGEYVKGEFEMSTTSGGPGGTETPLAPQRKVEVRLKGSGSFRPITEKAALKLKFKKSEAFLGLRKMTLNNMVQDPSMAHEALSYLAFGAAGVPAPRSGYAFLRVNGDVFGLYADIETLDSIALEKRFGKFEAPPQHLYEGESGHDVTPGSADAFEVDEGEETERGDLEELIEAVNGSGAEPWSDRVAPYVDLKEMTRMWAVEHYIADWDGYAGHAEAGLRPNNYYLFSDASGRFQMLPWGADQTWDLNLEIPHRIVSFDNEGGVMFNLCLEDEACRLLYWEALGEVTEAIEAMEPGPFLAAAAATLLPWEELEREEGRPEFDAKEVEAEIKETAKFIDERPEEARTWLAANEPPAEEEPPPKEEHPTKGEPPIKMVEEETRTRPQKTLPRTSGGRARLGKVSRRGTDLIIGVHLPGPANVRVKAAMGKAEAEAEARDIACHGAGQYPAAGSKTITCPLSPAALKLLSQHALRLRLSAAVTPKAGPRKVLTRQLRLARTGAN